MYITELTAIAKEIRNDVLCVLVRPSGFSAAALRLHHTHVGLAYVQRPPACQLKNHPPDNFS
jgi:hypothetical protein